MDALQCNSDERKPKRMRLNEARVPVKQNCDNTRQSATQTGTLVPLPRSKNDFSTSVNNENLTCLFCPREDEQQQAILSQLNEKHQIELLLELTRRERIIKQLQRQSHLGGLTEAMAYYPRQTTFSNSAIEQIQLQARLGGLAEVMYPSSQTAVPSLPLQWTMMQSSPPLCNVPGGLQQVHQIDNNLGLSNFPTRTDIGNPQRASNPATYDTPVLVGESSAEVKEPVAAGVEDKTGRADAISNNWASLVDLAEAAHRVGASPVREERSFATREHNGDLLRCSSPKRSSGENSGQMDPQDESVARAPCHRHGKRVLVAQKSDQGVLSTYQCLVREQLYFFEVTVEDMKRSAQGRNKPIIQGQVGLLCKHCAKLDPKTRPRGSVYFPGRIDGIYQSAQNIVKNHLLQTCKAIPNETRDRLYALRQSRDSMWRGGRHYWIHSSKTAGVIELDSRLFFATTSTKDSEHD